MPEFFNVLSPEAALEVLSGHLGPLEGELIETSAALGRVTAQQVSSPEALPAFPRSTMDGFSVRASDTYGASEGLPAYLELVGEVPMGQATKVGLSQGQTAVAYTGGMLADGRNFIEVAWWLITIPGLAIMAACLASNLLGDWLRDTFDPMRRQV